MSDIAIKTEKITHIYKINKDNIKVGDFVEVIFTDKLDTEILKNDYKEFHIEKSYIGMVSDIGQGRGDDEIIRVMLSMYNKIITAYLFAKDLVEKKIKIEILANISKIN